MTEAEATAGAKPRWERRKDARPAELIAAALELFVDKGYAGTRLEDVAARAGVSKGTLYLYFENKEDLLKAVVQESVVARISETAEELAHFEGSSAELVSYLIHGWWRDYGASAAGGISKLMMAESGNFPEIARFFLEEVIDPWHALLAQAIRRGIDAGEFRPVETETFVRVITAPLVMLSLWKRSFGVCSARPIDADRFIETLVDTMLAALRPRVAG
jgi:AcrR family transcriptional regulator